MTDQSFEIRQLGPTDHAVFNNLHEDVFDHALRATSLARFLEDPRHVIFVALADNQVVGMCSGVEYFHPDSPSQMFLNEIGVAEPYRRKGLGRQLAAALLTEAGKRGCASMWLGTETDNIAAQKLYESVDNPTNAGKFLMYEWNLEK